MSDKYIHIGFPKNFSTSLQRSYFSIHPGLYHLGIGLNDDNLGYIDTTVEKTLEVYLKTCKDYKYHEVKDNLKKHFKHLFQKGKATGKKVGISAEHLSFSFSYDSISSRSKAERLHDIFGSDTTILIIVRNQYDIIRSLYRESIRVGYSGTFAEYFYLFYKYQDRNYFYDIAFSNAFKTYARLFGEHNVKFLFFEDYRDKNGSLITGIDGETKLITDLNKALDVEGQVNFSHFNQALTTEQLQKKRLLNKERPHDLSNHLLETAEKHRIKSYLDEDLLLHEEESKMYEDVLAKRELIKEATLKPSTLPLEFSCDSKIKNTVQEFFLEDNRRLQELLKINLPKEYVSKWK